MSLVWIILYLGEVNEANLYERTMAAYERGLGQATAIAAEGQSQASQAVGPWLETATVSMDDESRLEGREVPERTLALELTLPLTPTAPARRASLTANRETLLAQDRLARTRFLEDTLSAYAAIARARAQAEHAASWHRDAAARDAELARPELQALVSNLDRLEQASFTSLLADERRVAEVEESEAHSQLAGLFGESANLAQPEPAQALTADNPYPRLLAQVARLPELRLLEREAEDLDAAAALSYAESAPRLGLRLQHRDAGENAWLGAGLQFSWSPGKRRGPEWQRQRANAEAARAQNHYRGQALTAALKRRSEAFAARQLRAQQLRDDRIATLRQRAELLEQAVASGLAERRIWLDALAEQHEAEHDLLAQSFALWEEHTRVLLLARFCEETP